MEKKITIKKIGLLVLLFIGGFSLSAQEAEKKKDDNGWKKSGAIALMFSQSAFNEEWTGGNL